MFNLSNLVVQTTRLGEKGCINQSVNEKVVCKTAPATLGFLIIVVQNNIPHTEQFYRTLLQDTVRKDCFTEGLQNIDPEQLHFQLFRKLET